MGRPSLLEPEAIRANGNIDCYIDGFCVAIMQGEIELQAEMAVDITWGFKQTSQFESRVDRTPPLKPYC